MRVSLGVMTFLVGLVILAIAGVIYQQGLVASGDVQGGATSAAPAANVKYMCPMRCVETYQPGDCPVCGMEMTAIELASAAPASSVELYTCPMHPQIIQDHHGTCPICGMELVPKVEDSSTVDSATQQSVAAVKLSPLQAVLADVQALHPSLEHVAIKVPAIGEVSVPQDQQEELVSWQAGRIDNLLLRETGGAVAEGDHILDIYSEELVQAQEEYLLALDAVRRLGGSGYSSISSSSERLLEAARAKLLRLGLTAEQLAELESSGQVHDHIPIYARYGGVVMEKFVTEGMYVMEGGPLFTVAKLDPIWVEVEIFERDAAELKAGDHVTMHCPIHPGMLFQGTIELIEPSLDSRTRTHRARVTVGNTQSILRPGMIMDAELTVDHGEVLLLQRNAVLHTGDGDLVYVLAGENQWLPRRVTVGRDFGDKVEIVSGLAADEAVAGTAVFLLDSEAQLKGVPRPLDIPVEPEQDAAGGAGDGGHQH